MASRVLEDKIKSSLNDKQKQFCIEYLKDLNGRQAYKRVYDGVTNESADVNSCKLLSNTRVRAYINALIDEYADNIDITIGEIVSELKNIALDSDARRSDKIKALELLGKYKQMFVDKVEVTNTDIVVGLE